MILPVKFVEAYQKKPIGLFIGSGMSLASGLPNWETLLNNLIDLALNHNAIDGKKAGELKNISKDSSKYLMVAEDLKEILHTDLYKYIKKTFDNNSLKPSTALQKAINLKYSYIITTNYDVLIEEAYVAAGRRPNDLTYKDAATINYNLICGDTFILKAHGDARRAPSEIILTENDYRNIIYKERGYQSVLQSLFSTTHVLFLGASLKDPELRLILGYIHNIFHGGSPDHFAFMSKDDLTQTEIDRWRKDYNINIIPYDPKNNHKELEDYIDEILKL